MRRSPWRWRQPRCSLSGASLGVPVGCLLTVSDTFGAAGARTRIGEDELLEAALAMGRTAVAALS